MRNRRLRWGSPFEPLLLYSDFSFHYGGLVVFRLFLYQSRVFDAFSVYIPPAAFPSTGILIRSFPLRLY
jgi:hypothetical protein